MHDTQYHPHEFFPTIENLPKVGQVVICGGQAVNLLAAVFLTEKQIETILGGYGSATSSDMDIIITRELQKQLFLETNESNKSRGFSVKLFADCRQPIQFVILPDSMPDTRIDVLRAIKGIHTEKDRVFEDSIDLENTPYNVLNPTTLLIAKAENCATLEQSTPGEKRNDVNHLRLLIPIVRNYLRELVNACDPASPASKNEQRDIIRFLKKLHNAAQNSNFKKGMNTAGANLQECIPIAHIRQSKLETLKNYLERTFLRSPNPNKNPPGSR